MSDWFDRVTRDGRRASGELQEYVYEFSVLGESEDAALSGAVQLRLVRDPSPMLGRQGDGVSAGAWEYRLRARVRDEIRGTFVSEPFGGALPPAVSGVGPWDPEPDEGFDPDTLAARLLSYVSDWRSPEESLSGTQIDWFNWLGPEVSALIPQGDEAAVEWVRGIRVTGQHSRQ